MKFTIRDVIWLTVVVAILVAWWLEWRGDALDRARDAETIEKLKLELENYRPLKIIPLTEKTGDGGIRLIPSDPTIPHKIVPTPER
jgi:hypothetical protein